MCQGLTFSWGGVDTPAVVPHWTPTLATSSGGSPGDGDAIQLVTDDGYTSKQLPSNPLQPTGDKHIVY